MNSLDKVFGLLLFSVFCFCSGVSIGMVVCRYMLGE